MGGHSIADADVKYGLSVMGTVHPDKIYPNNQGRPGDKLILTKNLAVGIGLYCKPRERGIGRGDGTGGCIHDYVK